jgi:hypothetical protein
MPTTAEKRLRMAAMCSTLNAANALCCSWLRPLGVEDVPPSGLVELLTVEVRLMAATRTDGVRCLHCLQSHWDSQPNRLGTLTAKHTVK